MGNRRAEHFLRNTQNGESSGRAFFAEYPKWGIIARSLFLVVPKMGNAHQDLFQGIPFSYRTGFF